MNAIRWAAAAMLAAICHAGAADAPRPNILWITCEDIGPHLGCYGDAYASTPRLDALAARGVRYRAAWSTAPVCAPARTAIISGIYPTSLGAEHMRSEVAPPPFLRMYPQFLREAGYYCSNNSKEDYNIAKPGPVWNDSSGRAHWRNRAPGQPFFAIFNFTSTHEGQVRRRPHVWQHDPARAPVPPWHPDTIEVRQDWAKYYDNITTMDGQAGAVLDELEKDGLTDDTIVFFYGDHGPGLPRCKRWPFESGLRVPLIVHIPPRFRSLAPPDYAPGGESKRLVGFIDLAPTVLSLAGIRPPEWMQGRAFLGPHAAAAPAHQFGFRGRMDERIDMVRSVRSDRYVYLRHYLPHRIYGQHIAYMFQTPTTRVWKEMYDAGKLSDVQRRFWEPKPPEELYDLEADPWETRNLAESPEHRAILEDMRRALRGHVMSTRDVGFLPEAEFHRRARLAGRTIGEMACDSSLYPLDRIFEAAETAARRDLDAVPRLQAALRDADSGVRFWAATGLLIRGAPAVAAARTDLLAALKDEAPAVRVPAAEALAAWGPDDDRAAALAALRDLLAPDRNGAYVSILALNAIDSIQGAGAALRDAVAALPLRDPDAPGRANGYVPQLVKHITGRPQRP